MKSSAKKIELASVDDLFSTEEGRQDAKLEKIQEIPLSELHPFKNHPFKVKDDEAMMETADSIKQLSLIHIWSNFFLRCKIYFSVNINTVAATSAVEQEAFFIVSLNQNFKVILSLFAWK